MDWAVAGTAGQRHGRGQVGRWLVYLQATNHVHKNILVEQLLAHPLGQHGRQQKQAVVIHAVGRSAGVGKGGGGGEGLDFDEKRPCPFHRHGNGRAGHIHLALHQEHFGGVGHLLQPFVHHLEHAHFAGGSKAVFHASQEAVAVEGVALQV